MVKKLNFSERYGYVDVTDVIQHEEMSSELRTALFNSVVIYITIGFYDYDDEREVPQHTIREVLYLPQYQKKLRKFFRSFYANILKRKITEVPEYNNSAWERFESYFNSAKWHEIYSLIEWFKQNIVDKGKEWQDAFQKRINSDLEDCMAGYRLVEGLIVPITDTNELAEVQTAVTVDKAEKHIKASLQCLHDKDFRNSVKESISAVEAVAREKTGERTLGAALAKLESRDVIIPNILKQGFQKIYVWTCGEDGIRHAIMDEAQEITMAEAKFMLVACSAFINYLKISIH